MGRILNLVVCGFEGLRSVMIVFWRSVLLDLEMLCNGMGIDVASAVNGRLCDRGGAKGSVWCLTISRSPEFHLNYVSLLKRPMLNQLKSMQNQCQISKNQFESMPNR